MTLVKNIMIGITIGGGMILPGVSGGVLAVIFGIYEKMLDSVANFFKDIKKNSLFLGPIIIGLIIGVLLFGKILFFLFDNYEMQAKYTFMGLILGGVPTLFKEIEKKGNEKTKTLILLISFIISIALFVLGKEKLNIDFSNQLDSGLISFGLLFLTGFLFISGKIIPGISSSFLLMLIGMYQFLLNVLNNPFGLPKNEYMQFIPFSLGVVVGAAILIKMIRYLLKNKFSATYSAIIGFVIGSISAIYPGITFDFHGIISIILFALGIIVSYFISLTTSKKH